MAKNIFFEWISIAIIAAVYLLIIYIARSTFLVSQSVSTFITIMYLVIVCKVFYRFNQFINTISERVFLRFNYDNFQTKFEEIIDDYKEYSEEIINYPYSAEKMSENYLNTFNDLYLNKQKIISSRENIYHINKFLKNIYLLKRKFKKSI